MYLHNRLNKKNNFFQKIKDIDLILLLRKFCPINCGSKLLSELFGGESKLDELKKLFAKSSTLVNFGSLSPMSCNATILLTFSVSLV